MESIGREANTNILGHTHLVSKHPTSEDEEVTKIFEDAALLMSYTEQKLFQQLTGKQVNVETSWTHAITSLKRTRDITRWLTSLNVEQKEFLLTTQSGSIKYWHGLLRLSPKDRSIAATFGEQCMCLNMSDLKWFMSQSEPLCQWIHYCSPLHAQMVKKHKDWLTHFSDDQIKSSLPLLEHINTYLKKKNPTSIQVLKDAITKLIDLNIDLSTLTDKLLDTYFQNPSKVPTPRSQTSQDCEADQSRNHAQTQPRKRKAASPLSSE